MTAYDSGKGRGAERVYRCPFCGASERAFHANSETGHFNCKRQGCQVKGLLREFWQDSPKLTGPARRRAEAAKVFRYTPTPAKAEPETEGPENWRKLWEAAASLDEAHAQPGRDYLAGRGLSVEVAIASGVRFCSNWAPSVDGGNYRAGAAVLFPLCDKAGSVRGVNGRYISAQATPKARTGGDLTAGAFYASAFVGDEWIKPLATERPFVVEGPADALALAGSGAPTMALSGATMQTWVAKALAFKRPFLAPDNDAAGAAALPFWDSEVSGFAPGREALQIEGAKDFAEMVQRDGQDALTEWLKSKGALLGHLALVPAGSTLKGGLTSQEAAEVMLEEAAVDILQGLCRFEGGKRIHGAGPFLDYGFGDVASAWRFVNQETGRNMNSKELVAWAFAEIKATPPAPEIPMPAQDPLQSGGVQLSLVEIEAPAIQGAYYGT